jgi:diketogulonate reductase-like aldo/keto reductase
VSHPEGHDVIAQNEARWPGIAPDGVDPAKVPTRNLYTGAKIPALGLGTFGSDRFSVEQIAAAVLEAASVGYRHFDCASVYGNEHLIGRSLRAIQEGGVRRGDLWVTSKLWNDKHGEADVIPSCEKSLRDLQLDYLDLYLVHWPFPNYHPPGCDVASRSPDAKPYIHENFLKTWRQMEALVDRGLVRHIGTSNMTIPKLKLLLRDARIRPACSEMELHPHFQQPELFQYVIDQGILPIGYCPIGSPNRPVRDRTEADTVDIEDPVIVRIARRLGVHPAVACVMWAVKRGQVPIPFSVRRSQMLANLKAVAGEPLTDDDMRGIAAIDKGCRLIKGQVFLWKEGQSWEELWDTRGEITPP